jgi:hypothetical protein
MGRYPISLDEMKEFLNQKIRYEVDNAGLSSSSGEDYV